MKTILITGGSGFLGRALAKALKDDYKVHIAARNNAQNAFAQLETSCSAHPLDIVNMESVKDVFHAVKPDIVIHAAATKFVDISEKNPFEAVEINVVGSMNIARAAIDFGCETVIGISTDKVAPPISNTYALTKSLMERMYVAMHKKSDTNFACVRFGNIAWSSGSVFPIWSKMADQNGEIQSTGAHMRRYMTTVEQAAEFVIRCLNHIDSLKGSVLIEDMKAVYMQDALEVFAELKGVAFKKIDARPGERDDEYLIGETELAFSEEIVLDKKRHFKFTPNQKVPTPLTEVYSTKTAELFSKDALKALIESKLNEKTSVHA